MYTLYTYTSGMATKTKKRPTAKAKSFVIQFRINEAVKAAADRHVAVIGLPSYTINDAARDAYADRLKSVGLL